MAVRLAAPRRGDPRRGRSASSTPASAAGRSTASPTRPRPARASTGSARACSAAAPITGAASRCASGPTTSGGAASTASATTGRSPTTTSSPTTTRSTGWSASSDRTKGCPNEPDGIFLPPPRPRCYELLIKQAADELKITCIPSRLSILTQPHNGRPACHYCGQCGRGCAIHSNFSSPSVLLPPALATGRLTIVTRAMAREVTTDDDGPGDRRRLHRHSDRPREPRARAHRGAGGERVRVGAPAAQLEVVALPERPGQLERRGRPLPDRHHRHRRVAASSRS